MKSTTTAVTGLRKPGSDQRWIRVDNQYLLIGITSGLIAGIVTAR